VITDKPCLLEEVFRDPLFAAWVERQDDALLANDPLTLYTLFLLTEVVK